MASVHPVIRYLIVCDEVRVDRTNPRKVSLTGLVSSIRSYDDPPFPVRHEAFCVYAQLTDFRGTGVVHVDVVDADTEVCVTRTPRHRVSFGNDPLDIVGVVIRVCGCRFPKAGLYGVRFWYNDLVIAEQPILLR
jgi:hypothetical protein